MKALYRALILWLALAAGSVQSAEPLAPLVLTIPSGTAPHWRGISPDEAAGTQGLTMLYPAPNAAGFLAAVLTHALLVQGGRSAQQKARQAEADKVLKPHAATIATLSAEVLLAAARERLAQPLLEAGRGLVVQMEPRYALVRDGRTLVLDNALRVHAADMPSVARFETTVRVISTPCDATDPTAHWIAEGGLALKRESAAMLAHSIAIALSPLAPTDAQAFRTQRYRFGHQEKMERGQPVATGCARIVLRTLRDWLMSVPITPVEGAAPCADPYGRLAE